MHVSSPPCSLCAVGCVYATLNISVVRIDGWHVVVVHNKFRNTVQIYFALSEPRVIFFHFSLLYCNFVQVSTPETWFNFALTEHRIFFVGVYYSSQLVSIFTVEYCELVFFSFDTLLDQLPGLRTSLVVAIIVVNLLLFDVRIPHRWFNSLIVQCHTI